MSAAQMSSLVGEHRTQLIGAQPIERSGRRDDAASPSGQAVHDRFSALDYYGVEFAATSPDHRHRRQVSRAATALRPQTVEQTRADACTCQDRHGTAEQAEPAAAMRSDGLPDDH